MPPSWAFQRGWLHEKHDLGLERQVATDGAPWRRTFAGDVSWKTEARRAPHRPFVADDRALGRLTEVLQGFVGSPVQVASYTWDGSDRVQQFEDGAGNGYRYGFDGAGRVRTVERRPDPATAWETWYRFDWEGPNPHLLCRRGVRGTIAVPLLAEVLATRALLLAGLRPELAALDEARALTPPEAHPDTQEAISAAEAALR